MEMVPVMLFIYSFCDEVEGYVEVKGDCDDTDPSINNIDADGDGLGLCAGDCDDTDPSIKGSADIRIAMEMVW